MRLSPSLSTGRCSRPCGTASDLSILDRVDVLQPTLFAVMVSLAAQWRALGIHPDAVLGHSQGEIAAAYVAGALSLRDAAKVVTLRSKALIAIAGTGGMVSIPLPLERVLALIEPWGQSISVAAHNGPCSCVVTGNAAALDELMAGCERDGLAANRIPVDYASHSAQVDSLRETLRESLSGLQPQTGDITFISAVTGAGLDTTILTGDYWFANLRQPVLFEQAVRWAYEHGYRSFVESSPHPVLIVGIAGITGKSRRRPQRNWNASTRRRRHAPRLAVGGRVPGAGQSAQRCEHVRRHHLLSHHLADVRLPTEAILAGPHDRIRRREQSRRRRPRTIPCSARLCNKQIQAR